MKQIIRKNIFAIGLICLAFLFNVCVLINNSIDSDTWFILNNGRYILENGIPHSASFTMHGELPIIMSQSSLAILEYLIFLIAGELGLFVLVCISILCMIGTVFYFIKENGGTNYFASIVASVTSIMLSNFYNNRPTTITMVLTILEIILIHQYIKSNNKRYLYGIPIISLLIANIHASLYIIVYLPILAWIGANIIEHFLYDKKLNLKTIFLTTLGMILFGLCNPYGIQGNLYLFSSLQPIYGDTIIIKELMPPKTVSIYSIYLIFILISLCVCVYRSLKYQSQLSLFHMLLSIGAIMMYPMAIRNAWIMILWSVPLISDAWIFIKGNDGNGTIKNICRNSIICILVISIFSTLSIDSITTKWNIFYETNGQPADIVKYLDTLNLDKENTTIYTSFNDGAYLEFFGYKPYIDARPELYPEIYPEYVDLHCKRIPTSDFLKKYEFDYCIIKKDINYSLNEHDLDASENYSRIYETSNYILYKKIPSFQNF